MSHVTAALLALLLEGFLPPGLFPTEDGLGLFGLYLPTPHMDRSRASY